MSFFLFCWTRQLEEQVTSATDDASSLVKSNVLSFSSPLESKVGKKRLKPPSPSLLAPPVTCSGSLRRSSSCFYSTAGIVLAARGVM